VAVLAAGAAVTVLVATGAAARSVLAASALPPPKFGQSLDIGLVSGRVIVTPPSRKSFVLGVQDRNIPVGSLIDVTHGRVDLRAARPPGAGSSDLNRHIEDAQFYDGKLTVSQPAGATVTDVKLRGSFTACTNMTTQQTRRRTGAARAAKRLPHKVIRLLWASGPGVFKTVGRYAAATVRGTVWLTEDFCDGTLVQVKRGVVSVNDLVTRRTIQVTAGHSFFAAAG
jgi:hypothetical protein